MKIDFDQNISFSKEEAVKANKLKKFIENYNDKKETPNRFIKNIYKSIIKDRGEK